MVHPERPHPRAFRPVAEGLERRDVPAIATASNSSTYLAAVAKHASDVYVAELKRIELYSLATPAQFQALRDDARAISNAASAPGATGSLSSRQNGAVAASLLLDRSLLQGWLGDQGWHEVQTRLTLDLSGSNVLPALIEKTTADMRSAAISAGVDPGSYQVFSSDLASFQSARDQTTRGFHDPQVYYTQHLRGFFRGWAVQKTSDSARLQADLSSIPQAYGSRGGAVIHRDVAILQSLGAAMPSDSFQALADAYVALFNAGTPSPAAQATFRAAALTSLGTAATPARVGQVDQLLADSPAFLAAAGSQANLKRIVDDVTAVVFDGAGSSLNPFKIVIRPGG